MNIELQNQLYRSALIYSTEYNLPVFPSSKQKIPLIENWYHRASKDPQVIKQWWGRWPEANVSMPTGSASSIIALDVDVKNDQPGFDSLRELEMKYGDLPKTPTSISPSGGQHFFFKYDGPSIGRRIRFMPGLDLMAEDSQILLPPSIGKNGKRYTWEISARIDETDFAPLPNWLLSLVNSSFSPRENGTSKSLFYWKNLVLEGASKGERNQAVAKMAGHLLRHYVEPFLALEIILLWNKFRNFPPLPEDEVINTVNSIAGKESRRRNGVAK